MKNKSTSQSILIGLVTVVVLLAFNSTVRAECRTTTWIDGAGDWFERANWDNCVPNSYVDASINNGGQAVIDHRVDEAIATAQSLILGDNQGSSGAVSIDTIYGGLAVLPHCEDDALGEIYVGKRGSGTLTVTNGATVWNARGYIAAEANPTRPAASGAVKMSGEDTWWVLAGDGCTGGAGLFVGCTAATDLGGAALLDIKDGAIIEVLNSVGHLDPSVKVGLSGTVAGNGLFILTGPPMSVLGTLAPAGTLRIAGTLALTDRATTVCNVTPQAWDSVQVVQQWQGREGEGWGYARLDGRLSVTMTGDFSSAPTRFTLLHADVSLIGMFSSESINYPTGHGWTPHIRYDYDGGNVYLDRVYDVNP